MPESDLELIAAVRAGDRAALERLLERHQAAVYRFGMKMCREEEDAKDILQETLLAAARTLPEFRGASSVTTWLYTIARSFCLKKRRTSKFAPQLESLDARDGAAIQVADARRGPEEDAAGVQLQAALDRAIAELDPMYREVLLLRDVEGLLLDGRELGAAPLLQAEAAGDRVEPGRNRGRPAEVLHASGHGEERLLQDVLRVLGVPAHLQPEPVDAPLVPLEQRVEGAAVAGAGAFEEGAVVEVHRVILP